MNDDRPPYDGIGDGRAPDGPGAPGDTGAPGSDLDDRLLALALGLDDDPGLRAQLAESVGLRARFERLRGELAAVEDGVRRVVPEEPEGWADLSHDRWSALKPYVSTEQAATHAADGRRTSWWRRWQTLAPVAATLVIAVAVLGVVMSRDGMMSLQSADESAGGSEAAPEKSADGQDYGVDSAVPGAGVTGGRLAIAGAEAYRTVVVARAGSPADGAQSYTVERTLKGEAPGTLELQTEVDGELAAGTLAVLFLDPVSDASPCPVPIVLAEEDGQPADASSPAADATAGGSRQPGSLYLYDGRCAVVVSLPDGMEPVDVDIQ
jgi:hypothetical protein